MNTQTTTANESEILIGIEQFIQRVLYTPRMSEQEFTYRLIELVPLFEMIYDPDVEYCSSIELFRFIADELRQMHNGQSADALAPNKPYDNTVLFSTHISRYQDYILGRKFEVKEELRTFKLQEQRNTNSLFQYLTKLTQHYSKLLFVRVDLGIKYDYQTEIGIEEFNAFIRRVLKRVHDQDTCFKDLQGYAWAIEQGEKKGYHCHLLLIYDGHKHQNDFGLASMVGECWKEITEDQGYFFTSNAPEYKNQLEQKGVLGIGMIHRNNPKQVLNAINAAMYLVNPEKDRQYLRAWVKSMRTFGRGQYELNRRRGCLEES
ncbi:inovirus Gp2 family protein [Acinetobacter modestus]|uniref:YagK/YfjJ domain-containing protein n=1 Tax=Acinetobacter modestus TaxID=1776740 RepID=UPI00202FEEB6|nr:inovirus-type Gp2 protein [Acinetobacter modestus]MCM1958201.1 inovirus Gp2 family protein [Acinetobacter modestus]